MIKATGGKCPLCGKDVVPSKSGFGCSDPKCKHQNASYVRAAQEG